MDQLNKTQIVEKLSTQLKELQTNAWNKLQEAENALFEDNEMSRRDKLDFYQWALDRNEAVQKRDIKSQVSAIDLFNRMAYDLNYEFDAKVDLEHFTIEFEWFGRTLSFPVKMIASRYNLHAGMFGFESSFTTHEAYTEDGYLIHIGIANSNSNVIVVSFGQLDILK